MYILTESTATESTDLTYPKAILQVIAVLDRCACSKWGKEQCDKVPRLEPEFPNQPSTTPRQLQRGKASQLYQCIELASTHHVCTIVLAFSITPKRLTASCSALTLIGDAAHEMKLLWPVQEAGLQRRFHHGLELESRRQRVKPLFLDDPEYIYSPPS